MKIMILGSGAREYSIALAIKKNREDISFYFAPGNGATSKLGVNLNIKDVEILATYAKEKQIDLCIVGSESFLAQGVADIFNKYKVPIFGPKRSAAMLEISKSFMKSFLKKYKIRTAKFLNTNNIEKAKKFIYSLKTPIVIKADGLCAGKGVIIANTYEEAIVAAEDMLSGKSFGDAGKLIVIEEFLDGYELSAFAVCDGEDFVLLPIAQDHKKLLDNDEGPNTGGMGAYAPSLLANENLISNIKKDIIIPTLNGMKNDGNEFSGVLFVGIMVVNNKPYVLEYNVRFGDPECEVLMPLIKNPLDLILASVNKKIKNFNLELENKFSLCVVCAGKDYPYKNSKNDVITIKDIPKNSHICYAGVDLKNDVLLTDGGRILVCVGLGDSINDARNNAYELCKNVKFNGMHYRKDIGYQALK